MPNPILGVARQIDQLPEANLPLDGDEVMAIVQNDTMRQVALDAWRWKSIGATADRPSLDAAYAGWEHYDTTLGMPLWWSGSAWKDATGAAV